MAKTPRVMRDGPEGFFTAGEIGSQSLRMHKVSSDELGVRDSSTGEVNNPFLQTRNPTISLRAAIQSETNDPYCGNKFFKCGGRLAETDK